MFRQCLTSVCVSISRVEGKTEILLFSYLDLFFCLFVCSTCIFQKVNAKLFLVLLNKDADRTPLLSLLNLFDCLNLYNFYKFQSNCQAFFPSLIGIFYNELVPFTPIPCCLMNCYLWWHRGDMCMVIFILQYHILSHI